VKEPPTSLFRTPLTPLSFLRRSASVFRDKPAMLHRGRTTTYAELAERALRLARALQGVGIQKGDRVAVLSPNTPAMLEAHFGVPAAGAVLVALNTRLTSQEIGYILSDCEARTLLVDSELAHLVAHPRGELPCLKNVVTIADEAPARPTGPGYAAFLAAGPPDGASLAVEDEDQLISLNYTSGTTGRPKGVMYTHRGAYLNALSQALELGLNAYTTYLWTLPMFHCNGWCYTWAVTAVGGTHVGLRRVDPAEVFRLIKEHQVTHLCAAPTVLIMLASHAAEHQIALGQRLHIATGGAPPAPEVIQRLESLGAAVTHLYGLTETYGPHSLCEWQPAWDGLPWAERARLKARQGVPDILSLEMRVVDDAMGDVPADGRTMGEVVMRGNTVMAGYYKQPAATAEAFRGGWFHSGDLGVVHPDGYLEVRDRQKDIIISGGENISTIEVESAVFEHPDVLEAAVIAAPDEKWGEVPKAFVVPKPGRLPQPEQIIAFCRERLAHFKCPQAVEIVAELPKTSTGKIQKYVLREKEWSGHDKRVH